MSEGELLAALEAVLFASGDAVSRADLARALEISPLELEPLEIALRERTRLEGSGIELIMLDGKLQLATKPQLRGYIERAMAPTRRQNLTQAALETLCVVAYRQPVTRMEIEEIRGVQSDHSVATLLAHGLIREVGRKETIGRPVLFGTTDEFLRHFGIASLDELPMAAEFLAMRQADLREMEE
ncbi:MAG: SMC-Scp complex subunit ScpB [Christensenellaceae bacterium]|jgi:segregation and condensation protein B|nr:SMC-Scp complex subunit ScpB [Christensenellaceae bacterium]